MKITVTKSGRFTYRKPRRGMIKVKEGAEINIETQIAQAMIESGWAEEVKAEPVKVKPEPKKAEPKPKQARKKKVKKDK
jgi:endonuclease YncB( thermonuclease family)